MSLWGKKSIWTETELRHVAKGHRHLGKKIVFSNGCFDILHPGHLDFLQQSRALGDCLIVAINDDDSVRALKGDTRPILRAYDRMFMLAALECVDYVYIFPETTAHRPIQLIRPHIYAKSGFQSEEEIPEAKYARMLGSQVVLIEKTFDISTTWICNRIIDAEIRKADALLR